MIKIEKATECCGCGACMSVCPKSCIDMKIDQEGFWYAKADEAKCIDCSLCEKVCPVINTGVKRVPLHVYAAINKDDEIRAKSSSGGMFTIVAEKVLSEGGVVFGVKFDERWNVVFGYTETIEGLEDFRKSKYVQAWVGDSYKQVMDFLKKGRKVLFTGTPCHIAALKNMLRKDYENLITLDLICEGVPSPKVWNRYLDEEIARSAKKYSFALSSTRSFPERNVLVKDISFRDKRNGWKKFSFALTFAEPTGDGENSVSLSHIRIDRFSAYMQLMFRKADLRPICYQCPFKCNRSQSDITIGDYWGINKLHPEMDDDKGTSMLYLNTEKGKEYFNMSRLRYLETPYEEALPFNVIEQSSVLHPKRDYFYANMDKKESIIKFMNSIWNPYPARVKKRIKSVIKSTMKSVIGQAQYEYFKVNVWRKIRRR